jgi:LacI family transcriptional regulator
MTTIKEIAEKAGVSIGTVDRVIHNRGYVSKVAETSVKQALEELNYRPNIFARQLKLSRTFNFGVLMPEFKQDSRYWQIPARGIEKAQKELESHRIQIQYFHYDRFSQMSFSRACEDVLSADMDGLLLVPALASIAEEFIRKLPDNLPYVFFDSTVPQSGCLSSIVQDSCMSGQLAGRLMHLILNGTGPIAVLRILPEDFHIEERVRGFQDYFSRYPQYDLKIYDAIYQGDVKRFYNLIHQILDENSDLKGFFISNALTYCAGRVLQERGIERKISVVGYDLLPENVRYLKEGTIDFLISQQSEQQGYQGIYTLFRRIVLNESVPEKIMMPIDIITKENVDYYQS